MVHDGSSSQNTLLLAFHTQGMDGQKGSSSIGPSPCAVQSVKGCCLALFGAVWPPVGGAGVCARLCVTRAAGFPTGTVGLVHVTPPQA